MSDFPNLDSDATIRGLHAGQRVFERYTLIRIVGRGGMGIVWLARDDKLAREVALKFLPEFFVHDQFAVDQLKRETSRCLALTHEGIVRIYDFLEDPEQSLAAISMEYVAGANLSNVRLQRPHRCFSVEELGPIIRQVCEALHYAHHRAHVVHRDIKPANLLLDSRGEVKITDFGIARSLADSASRVSADFSSSAGTLSYMSPQQALGERASEADDIYALGATIYDLLTGRPPFHSGNVYAQLKELVPPPMSVRRVEFEIPGPNLPAAWEATVLACLEKRPERRPQSAMEVAERLGQCTAGNTAYIRTPERGALTKNTATAPRKGQEGNDKMRRSPTSVRPKRFSYVFNAILAALGFGLLCGSIWWLTIEQPRRQNEARAIRLASERAEAERAEAKRAEAEKKRAANERERLAREAEVSRQQRLVEEKKHEEEVARLAQEAADLQKKNKEMSEAAEAARIAKAKVDEEETRKTLVASFVGKWEGAVKSKGVFTVKGKAYPYDGVAHLTVVVSKDGKQASISEGPQTKFWVHGGVNGNKSSVLPANGPDTYSLSLEHGSLLSSRSVTYEDRRGRWSGTSSIVLKPTATGKLSFESQNSWRQPSSGDRDEGSESAVLTKSERR